MVANTFLVFVRGIVLLIDDDHAGVVQGRED